MQTETDHFTIAQARNQLSKVVQQAERNGSVVLTRRGKPVAVLLSHAEHRRLTERIEPVELWDAIDGFRAANPPPAGMDRVFDDLRDPSTGRPVRL